VFPSVAIVVFFVILVIGLILHSKKFLLYVGYEVLYSFYTETYQICVGSISSFYTGTYQIYVGSIEVGYELHLVLNAFLYHVCW
jgi:hypothetical protein